MTYDETTEYLFNSAPLFQNVGKTAYKDGLANTHTLDEYFGHSHTQFKTVHVAGTNGKGSCSHTIAAILQSAGYRVGLFTSPHLVDFRERIRVNGEKMSKQYVIDFVENHRSFFEPLHPSFFELTTAMAFRYFADMKVDVAVIEVGLGGRLDCTNIITPVLSLITNISFDHTQFLGDTLAKIAAEKAGIIKHGIPAIIGEYTEETRPVFENKAKDVVTEITFAEDTKQVIEYKFSNGGGIDYLSKSYEWIHGELGGQCQTKNTNTILCAVEQLATVFDIRKEDVIKGFAEVTSMTGLMGRWQKIHEHPTAICDTGHNVGGFEHICKQLQSLRGGRLHIVLGMVNDKDINGVLSMLPKDATYYFCQASVKRALDHEEIRTIASRHSLFGNSYPNVVTAYEAALGNASPEDNIYIGGSSFVVADLLASLPSA